ncbi:MAG TPA: hypothetical protein VI451_03965 [Anaerolineales bacterium]|nr:hypothetical protein [Anaerolineales bacterium]
MREWQLQRDALPSLILAADARLTQLNYFDDQIWELHLRTGEPAALSLQTTYGLRARSMRLFPRFVEKSVVVTDPDEFSSPPAIHRFFPNYALLTCAPFAGIDVVFEYWVAFSNVLAGRIRVINSGVTPRSLRLEWAAILVPAGEGQRMSPTQYQSVHVLQGQVQGLSPVIFMTGGLEAIHSPYPSLIAHMDLLPGLERRFTWVAAALADPEASFTLARTTAARDWDAEYARIEMTNASQVEIETGNPNWNMIFDLGQKTALNLLHGPTEFLPYASWVQTRLPDQGHSLRSDGSEYGHLWDGQTPLDTWHLCEALLPAYPKLAQGLLRNFLATQNEDGHIDWKPGLNGRRTGILATPILCSLAWKIYLSDEDQTFLDEVLSPLLKFFNYWFDPRNDRDGDGIPEWSHPVQTGFEDNPLFAYWQSWSQGADISLFESPALTGMLFREAQSLLKMARKLGRLGPIHDLNQKIERLKTALTRAWDDDTAAYRYLDRETHISPSGKQVGKRKGPGTINLTRFQLDKPCRLLVRIHSEGEWAREAKVIIAGADTLKMEQVEELTPDTFRWSLGLGTGVSKQVFTTLEKIEIDNIQPEDQVLVHVVDFGFHDQTLFTPLWAGVPSPEQAEHMIKKHIMRPSRYWHGYGLPACPAPESRAQEVAEICETVWLPWNALIGEGLVQYGYQVLAAELLSRLMDAMVKNLRKSGTFRKHFHSATGQGIGERNALSGLPPVGWFLQILGVNLYSPWKVGLKGNNPFPWPVKIRFRGLTVSRDMEVTLITFPDGQTVKVSNPAPCIITGRP